MQNLPKQLGLALSAFAVVTSYLGLGLPNHPYQTALAALTLLLAYHRKWLPTPKHLIDYTLAGLNALVFAMQYKLLIGGGIRAPFAWLKFPMPGTAESTWFQWLPKIIVNWQSVSLTNWQMDLTVVQSFLLLVTALTGWLRFQPFASFALILLLVVSLPSYVDFQWNWLLPAMAAALVSFYVQAHAVKRAPAR